MFTRITYLKNAVSYVEAEGKLDIYNAPDYLDEIKEHMKHKYTVELILDFSKIGYAASIGLRAILELYKIMHGRKGLLKLKNVNEEIMHEFNFTGFDKFLTIDNTSDNGTEENSAEENNA